MFFVETVIITMAYSSKMVNIGDMDMIENFI
jgi:hypothetical protein